MRQVDLPPQFVIPGGTEVSAALDVARAMIRRAERRVVALRDAEGLASEIVIGYLNRASDLAYAMARWADEENPQLFSGRRESTEAKRDTDDA
jgi:cob(I)alamin adenosyltransferase